MKKLGLVALFAVVLLAGCSAEEMEKAKAAQAGETTSTTTSTAVETKGATDAPAGKYSGQKEIGDGSLTVRLAEKVVGKEVQPYLSLVTRDFNEDKSTFVYVDGTMIDVRFMTPANDKVMLGQGEPAAEVGKHTVEFVQTENDKQSGTVSTYRSAVYEVKK